MPKWKEGDRVRVVRRPVTEEDRKTNRYFEHMAGLEGVVQQVYSDTEVALEIAKPTLSDTSADVHRVATDRLREKFLGSISEEQKKLLTKEELDFDTHFVLLTQAADLEKA